MAARSSTLRKVMVLLMAFAVVVSYSVLPMNQSFAASAKKPAKVKSVKVKALNDADASIQITWKKAKNAKKYQVYRATKKKGKYKKVATVKAKTKKYVNKGLKDGQKYFYKVRAINGKKKGKFSSVKSAVAKKVVKPAPAPAPAPTPTPAPDDPDVTVTSDPVTVKKMTTEIDMSDSKYDGSVVRVWVPVPKSSDEQTVWGEDFDAPAASDGTGFKTETNSGYENNMLYLEWSADTPAADRTATLSFNVARKEMSNRDLKEPANPAIPSEVEKYITEETNYVKVNDPIVKEYAEQAAAGKTAYLEKVRAIYDWCIANLERIDNGEELEGTDGKTHKFTVVGCGYGDTVQILTDLKNFGRAGGHCTDINSTFVALCRANGIPAREMFGIRLSDDATGGQHCWAQFYLPDTGWVYADPGDVCKFGIKDNKSMLNMTLAELKAARATKRTKAYTEYYWGAVDSNRVELSKGRDILLNPEQNAAVEIGGKSVKEYNTFGYPCGEFGNGDNFTRIECTDSKNFKYTIKCDKSAGTITAEALAESLGSPECTILDVRKNDDFNKGHIPGAISADVDGAVSGADKAAATENIKKALSEDPEMNYALICYSGNAYANAARNILIDQGVPANRIYVLAQDDGKQGSNGGMKAWNAKYPNCIVFEEAGDYGTANISAENLKALVDSGANPFVVLDVRDKNRTGATPEEQAKDAYDAGHIAGAVKAKAYNNGTTEDADAGDYTDLFGEGGYDTNNYFVTVCYSGQRYANKAYQLLKAQGVADSHIIRLKGGMGAWTAAGYDVVPVVDDSVTEKTVYVTPQWLRSAIAGEQEGYENIVVCEVAYADKGHGNYSKGHVPGAIKVNVVEVEDADGKEGAFNILSVDQIRSNLLAHGITSDTKVVLYDAGGDPCEVGRQAYAYIVAGVKDVKVLNGNLAAWEKANYNLETKENTETPAESFGDAEAHLEYWTSIDSAKAKLDKTADTYDENFKLVSIRSYEEWTGQTSGYDYIDYAGEPEGAVWGKGAETAFDVNGFLNEDGTVKDLDGFKEAWKDCKFKVDDSEHLSFYCGTGWRATVPFLVLYENGYQNISVYDGGWYEWVYAGSHTYDDISYKDGSHDDYPVQVGDPDDESCQHITVGQLPKGKAAK